MVPDAETVRRMARTYHEGERGRGRALEAAFGVDGGWPTYLAIYDAELGVVRGAGRLGRARD